MAGPIPVLTNGQSSSIGIWDTGATAGLTVGTRGTLDDGRVYYYARNSGSAALVAGNLLISEVVNSANEDIAVNTAVAGDTSITITSGTATANANDFARGYVHVVDELGEGIIYQIASHPAITATAEIAIALVYPVNVTFHANATVVLVKNPWMDVVISATGQAKLPAGVSQVAVAAGDSNAQFFWCQTWGMSAGFQDEASAIGAGLVIGTGVAGQFEAQDLVGEVVCAWEVFTGSIGEYQPVFLRIAP